MKSPEQILRLYSDKYPGAWREADRFRRRRGKDLPNWPGWCFCPVAGWLKIANQDRPKPALLARQLKIVEEGFVLAALGAWRFSKGIYSFEPEIRDALINAPLAGELPTEAFLRLPEWSVFIDTQGAGLHHAGHEIIGFWTYLDCGPKLEGQEIRLEVMCDGWKGLIPFSLPLGRTLIESMGNARLQVRQDKKLMARLENEGVGLYDESDDSKAALGGMLPLVLYLCSDQPDIAVAGRGAKIHGQTKIVPGSGLTPEAPQVTYHLVGQTLARELRAAEGRERGPVGERLAPRPHLRRGHWHSFWTGPKVPTMSQERKLAVKFVMPTLVGGGD